MSTTPEWKELKKELIAMLAPGQWLALKGVHTSVGHAWYLSVMDWCPGSDTIAVTDEKLLAKLRSVKGQFVDEGSPVFYIEYLPNAGSGVQKRGVIRDIGGKNRPYIEILGAEVKYGQALSKADLCFIGEFTRENISRWLDRGYSCDVGIYGYVDFHAVCGDIDIPWTTEEARLCWTTKVPFAL